MLSLDSSVRILNDLLMNLGIVLPNSRKTEAEADRVGLLVMASGCYSPEEAISFWERMDTASKGSQHRLSSPSFPFLSTHPSHGQRIQELESFMPEATLAMESANCQQQYDSFWQRYGY